MACERNVPTNSTYIQTTLNKIDQLQKETTIESYCEGCDAGLSERIYNTKPIKIYLQGGNKLLVDVPNTAPEVTVDTYRIEDIRGDSVVLRLIDLNQTPQCLDYTMILNIGCICGLQCLPPICCEPCFRCGNRA